MKSKYTKVGHKVLGRPMLDYIVEAAEDGGSEKIVVIVGDNEKAIKDTYKDRLCYKRQVLSDDYPYGTGYAVSLAKDEIDDGDNVLILTGDAPLLRAETLRGFYNFHIKNDHAGSLLSFVADNPKDYGRVIRDSSDCLKAIVEEKDASEDQKAIKEVNSGVFIFKGKELKEALKGLDSNNAQGEIYLTDVIGILAGKGEKLGVYQLEDPREAQGVNSKDQLAYVQEIMRERVNKAYMREGVIMENPSNIYIEPGAKIGRDTLIGSGVRILGDTVIGEDCRIEGDTSISSSTIGDRTHIRSSYIEDSSIGSDVKLGPFANIRPKSVIKDKVKIGDFVEVKKSTIGEASKAGHHAYIGDASLGSNVNVGCGTIFANYDGKVKHHTDVGDNAFIGSNSTLVAPVTINKNSFVAADSVVIKDVKEGALYITRARDHQIENWYYKKMGGKDEE